MARRVFYSFHYKPDVWRVAKIRNIGAVEGNPPVNDNDWESITKGGDARIMRWIADQLMGKSCTVVLIGEHTATRKWINYEIVKTWDDKKGVVGVYIHNLIDRDGQQAQKGPNPLDYIKYGNSGRMLSSVVQAHDPPYSSSGDVYNHIRDNLADWIDEAIAIRAEN